MCPYFMLLPPARRIHDRAFDRDAGAGRETQNLIFIILKRRQGDDLRAGKT